MARSRNIKPGFFRNADLVELPYETRLLFIGLWTIADREGRLEDRPKQIRMEIFPADNVDCDAMLSALADTGMVIRYQANGRRFLQVTNFSKHQNPHRDERASTIPAPGDDHDNTIDATRGHGASTVQTPCKTDASTGQAPCEHDASTVGIRLIPDSLLLIPDSNTSCPPSAGESPGDGFADFWAAYPRKEAKPSAMKAWRKLRLDREGVAALMAGLETWKRSEQWQRDGGQYIPHPTTWLNNRRWEDHAAAEDRPPAQVGKPKAGATRVRSGIQETYVEGIGWSV